MAFFERQIGRSYGTYAYSILSNPMELGNPNFIPLSLNAKFH